MSYYTSMPPATYQPGSSTYNSTKIYYDDVLEYIKARKFYDATVTDREANPDKYKKGIGKTSSIEGIFNKIKSYNSIDFMMKHCFLAAICGYPEVAKKLKKFILAHSSDYIWPQHTAVDNEDFKFFREKFIDWQIDDIADMIDRANDELANDFSGVNYANDPDALAKTLRPNATKSPIDPSRIIDRTKGRPGPYRITVSDKQYGSTGAVRFIYLGKKQGNTYVVKVGSPSSASYMDRLRMPRFETVQDAINFCTNFNAGADTTTDTSQWVMSITDKPDTHVKPGDFDPSNLVSVNTTCGPALMSRSCKYCEESLHEDIELDEANTLSEEEKMQMLDNKLTGKTPARGLNVNSTNTQNLIKKADICRGLSLDAALDYIEAELYARGEKNEVRISKLTDMDLVNIISNQIMSHQIALDHIYTVGATSHPISHYLKQYFDPIAAATVTRFIDNDAIYINMFTPNRATLSRVGIAITRLVLVATVASIGCGLENLTGFKPAYAKEIVQQICTKLDSGKVMSSDRFKRICKEVANKVADDIITNFWGVELNESMKIRDIELEETIEKHDELNPKLFDGDKLKPEVIDKVQEIVNQFIESLEEDEIKINVVDIQLVGSNVSYNYTKDSDLDIHIIVDTKSLQCPDNLYPLLYGAYRSIFNNKFDINFYGIPVELFIEEEGSQNRSTGIYSVMKDEWIKVPDQTVIPEIDQESFDKEFNEWENAYNELIDKMPGGILNEDISPAENNAVLPGVHKAIDALIADEWEAISGYNDAIEAIKRESNEFSDVIDVLNDISEEEQVHVGELQKCLSKVDNKVEDNIADGEKEAEEKMSETEIDEAFDVSSIKEVTSEDIEAFIDAIYEERKKAMKTEGEFGIGNLIFKEFRNRGYLDNLKDLKNKVRSKELSLESIKEFEEEMKRYLTDEELYKYRTRISQIAHAQAVVQPTGYFNIYNIKEDDARRTVSLLQKEDFIETVSATSSGKYDFRTTMIGQLPKQYQTISGKIKL